MVGHRPPLPPRVEEDERPRAIDKLRQQMIDKVHEVVRSPNHLSE